MKPVYLKH